MTARSSINQYQYRSNAESPIRKGNRNLDVNVSRLLPNLRSSKTQIQITHYKNTKIQVHKYTVHIIKVQKHKYTVHITKYQNTSAQFYITKLHKYTSAESPVGKGNLDVNVSSLLPDRRSLKTEETTLTDVLPQCISTFTINAQIQMKLQKYEYKGAKKNLQNYWCTTSIQMCRNTSVKIHNSNVQIHKYKCTRTQIQMFKYTKTNVQIHTYTYTWIYTQIQMYKYTKTNSTARCDQVDLCCAY